MGFELEIKITGVEDPKLETLLNVINQNIDINHKGSYKGVEYENVQEILVEFYQSDQDSQEWLFPLQELSTIVNSFDLLPVGDLEEFNELIQSLVQHYKTVVTDLEDSINNNPNLQKECDFRSSSIPIRILV